MSTLVVNTQTTKNNNQQTLINNVNISSDIKAEYKETTIEIDTGESADNVFNYPNHVYPSGVNIDNNYNIMSAFLTFIDVLISKRYKKINNKYILYKDDYFKILTGFVKGYTNDNNNKFSKQSEKAPRFQVLGDPLCNCFNIVEIGVSVNGTYKDVFSIAEIKSCFDNMHIDCTRVVGM